MTIKDSSEKVSYLYDIYAKRYYYSLMRSLKDGIDFKISRMTYILLFSNQKAYDMYKKGKKQNSRKVICTIDRINENKGYCKGNIRVISHIENNTKYHNLNRTIFIWIRYKFDKNTRFGIEVGEKGPHHRSYRRFDLVKNGVFTNLGRFYFKHCYKNKLYNNQKKQKKS